MMHDVSKATRTFSHKWKVRLSETTVQFLRNLRLSLPTLCQLGASWLVDMADHFANNPDIIVSVFIKSGICGALDDLESDEDSDEVVEDDQFSESSMSEESTASSDESDD